MEAAEVVGAFWLVANALERDPSSRLRSPAARSPRRLGALGAGVYEAVVTTLATER